MSSCLSVLLALAAVLTSACAKAEKPSAAVVVNASVVDIPLDNPGFESGVGGWQVEEGVAMSLVVPEAAHTGGFGLRVTDASEQEGSSVATARLPVAAGRVYRVGFWWRTVSGGGIAVYLRFFDKNGRQLNAPPAGNDFKTIEGRNWNRSEIIAVPSEDAAFFDVRVHSFAKARVVADIDDVSVETFEPDCAPPWPPVYKFDLSKPSEQARLTAADVVGPDGLVYPNWRHVGILGGIPSGDALPALLVKAADFPVPADRDIATALQQAVDEAGAKGGGVIELPEGEFRLSHSVIVRDDRVVIRGAGRDRTRLIFDDHIPYGTLRSWCWTPSGKIGPDGFFEVQANPKNLVLMRVTANGATVAEEQLRKHWGNRYYLRMRGENLLAKLGAGKHRLDFEAGYRNGDHFTDSFEVEVSETPQPKDTWADQHGALVIAGGGLAGPELPLMETAHRGETRIHLADGHGFKPGDRLMVLAPATPRWNKLTGNSAPWGTFRTNQYEVTAVDGGVVEISEPLRIDFPVEDGSTVQRIRTVEDSGIEGLTIEQKVITTKLEGERNPLTGWYPMADLWTDGVTFSYAWHCWIRDVRIINAGRNPIYLTRSKSCEVVDVEADGALFYGGGGTAYLGIERSFDCLMDGIVTRKLRHAPDLQWGSAGNVVRNSHFIGSDGQWHAGWTHENLFENNIIELTAEDMANGAYGHGLFASGPTSPYHGPQGPRNVVYNNDISAPKDGLHMVGGNEGWLILHNRFRLVGGRAVYGKEKTFDHTIRNNVFVIQRPVSPVVFFGSADCSGIELEGNAFYGPIKQLTGFAGNIGRFAKLSGNTVSPYPADAADMPERPRPAVLSIFEWEQLHNSPHR